MREEKKKKRILFILRIERLIYDCVWIIWEKKKRSAYLYTSPILLKPYKYYTLSRLAIIIAAKRKGRRKKIIRDVAQGAKGGRICTLVHLFWGTKKNCFSYLPTRRIQGYRKIFRRRSLLWKPKWRLARPNLAYSSSISKLCLNRARTRDSYKTHRKFSGPLLFRARFITVQRLGADFREPSSLSIGSLESWDFEVFRNLNFAGVKPC